MSITPGGHSRECSIEYVRKCDELLSCVVTLKSPCTNNWIGIPGNKIPESLTKLKGKVVEMKACIFLQRYSFNECGYIRLYVYVCFSKSN